MVRNREVGPAVALVHGEGPADGQERRDAQAGLVDVSVWNTMLSIPKTDENLRSVVRRAARSDVDSRLWIPTGPPSHACHGPSHPGRGQAIMPPSTRRTTPVV
jgi:hypothetical protein